MYQYQINIINDNRGGKNYGEIIGEGSSYKIAEKKARAEAQKAIDTAGADYITRWSECKRNVNAYNDSWQPVGEYCK